METLSRCCAGTPVGSPPHDCARLFALFRVCFFSKGRFAGRCAVYTASIWKPSAFVVGHRSRSTLECKKEW